MLLKSEFTIIDALHDGRKSTPKTLANETHLSRSTVYRAVDSLVDANLVKNHNPGGRRHQLSLTTNPVNEQYRHLKATQGHVEWADLLSPSAVRVLWCLLENRDISEVSSRLNITRQACHQAMKPFKRRSMINSYGPRYRLISGIKPLHSVVRELVIHGHRVRARREAPSATIAWSDPTQSIIRIETQHDTEALLSDDQWELTGLARFRDYGLDFGIPGEPQFAYGVGNIEPAELVCHTLVLNQDSRRIAYSMLLIEKCGISLSDIRDTAEWFGIDDILQKMFHALAGTFPRFPDHSFPSEQEYNELKTMYGMN